MDPLPTTSLKPLSGKLTIHIQGATNLKNADAIGKSDPYVRLYLESEGKTIAQMKTKVIDDNLNPLWKERYHFVFPSGKPLTSVTLIMVVWDEDVGEDEFLGQVVVDLNSNFPFGVDQNVDLAKRTKKDSGIKGKLNFKVEMDHNDRAIADSAQFKTYQFPNGKSFNCLLGPILHSRGCDRATNLYRVAILVVSQGAGGATPDLTICPPPVNDAVRVTKLLTHVLSDRQVFIYEFSIKQMSDDIQVAYSIAGKQNAFFAPGIGASFRAVATSCNGFHDDAEKLKIKEPEFNLYTKMKDLHEKHHFHANLGGGDQLYCDPLWNLPGFKKYFAGDKNVVGAKLTTEMDEAVEKFYMDQYISSWSSPEMSTMYASIPNCMTWDDHDIFDGWGSYPNKIQESDIYQGIWKHAERYYCAFQLGCTPDKLPITTLPGNHFGKTQIYEMGDTAILNLDLRSERQMKRVCRPETYTALQAWFDAHHDFAHVIVVSSIPICYNDFSLAEKTLSITGGEMLDDLLDHWRAKEHQKERKMFVKMLFEYATHSNTRVTIISGDVHLAAIGAMHHKKHLKKSNAGEINCLITSAIVNAPPPNAFVDGVLQLSAGTAESVTPHITSGLCKFQPKRKWYYINFRNFMTIEETPSKDLFCHWISEDPNAIEADNTLLIGAWATGGKPDQVIENEGTLTTLHNMAHHAVSHIGR